MLFIEESTKCVKRYYLGKFKGNKGTKELDGLGGNFGCMCNISYFLNFEPVNIFFKANTTENKNKSSFSKKKY